MRSVCNKDFQNSWERNKKIYAHPLYLKKNTEKPSQRLQSTDLILHTISKCLSRETVPLIGE
jgi:hypothetical protein